MLRAHGRENDGIPYPPQPAQNGLCFSWRLLLYPPEAVDYVVVHELAHILEKNHAPAFYRLIAGVLPDYRARERLLKEIPAKGEPRNDP